MSREEFGKGAFLRFAKTKKVALFWGGLGLRVASGVRKRAPLGPFEFTFHLLNYPRRTYSEPKTAVPKVSNIYFIFVFVRFFQKKTWVRRHVAVVPVTS